MEGDGLVSYHNTLPIKILLTSSSVACLLIPPDRPKLLSQESTQPMAADRGNPAMIVVFPGLRRKKKKRELSDGVLLGRGRQPIKSLSSNNVTCIFLLLNRHYFHLPHGLQSISLLQ